jgi:methylmalonyl-CoA mutase
MSLNEFLKSGLEGLSREAWADRIGRPAGAPPPQRPRAVARIDDPDTARAGAQAQAEIAGGAEGLALVFEGGPNAFGYGLPPSDAALDAVLSPVLADLRSLRLDTHSGNRTTVEKLAAFLSRSRADAAKLDLSLGVDPVAVFAGTGRLRMSVEALEASMPQSLAHFFTLGVPAILLEADARVFHNAGASAAQELGAALAAALAYLRLFERARQPLVYAAPHVGFCVSLDQDIAGGAAKLKALAALWRRVCEGAGIPPAEPHVHAETSRRMLGRDADANVARNAAAALAAESGGAASFAALPHTQPWGLPGPAARSLARATQRVLALEAGAPLLLEDRERAARLCGAAWEELRRIVAEGGIFSSLEGGRLQARIRDSRRERAAAIRSGALAIVGPGGGASPDTLPAQPRPLPSEGAARCARLDVAPDEDLAAEFPLEDPEAA